MRRGPVMGRARRSGSPRLLAVEVISPSSGRTDRVVKRDYYMNAGVPEYWVVDLIPSEPDPSEAGRSPE
jgi:Uma2 family endonuclease